MALNSQSSSNILWQKDKGRKEIILSPVSGHGYVYYIGISKLLRCTVRSYPFGNWEVIGTANFEPNLSGMCCLIRIELWHNSFTMLLNNTFYYYGGINFFFFRISARSCLVINEFMTDLGIVLELWMDLGWVRIIKWPCGIIIEGEAIIRNIFML